PRACASGGGVLWRGNLRCHADRGRSEVQLAGFRFRCWFITLKPRQQWCASPRRAPPLHRLYSRRARAYGRLCLPTMTNEGCYSCRLNAADGVALPIRERIFDDGNWRVVHAISSSLPGWLCVVSRRHITTLSELSAAEAEALGPLLKRLSDALERVTGALKCYVMFFAEAPGFEHLHIHVAPR